MTPQEARIALKKADELKDRRFFKEAYNILNTIISIFEENEDWESYVKAYNIFAGCYYYESKFDEAEASLNTALLIGQKYIDDAYELTETYNIMGVISYECGRLDETKGYWGKALKLRKEILPENHIDIANSHNNLGILYMDQSDFDGAFTHFDEASKICDRNEIRTSIEKLRAKVYLNKGQVFRLKGEYKRAFDFTKKALNMNLELYENNDTKVALSYLNMGTIYGHIGKYEKELLCYREAIRIWEKIDKEHTDLPFTYNGVGMYYYSIKKFNVALDYFNKAVEFWEKLNVEHHELIRPIRSIALCYNALGNPEKAFLFLKKTYKLQRKIFKKHHVEQVETFIAFSDYFLCQKKFKKASKSAHKAINRAIPKYKETNMLKNPNISDLAQNIAPIQLLSALAKKGECLLIWANKTSKNKKIKYLEVALESFQAAIDLIDYGIKKDFKSEKSISLLFKQTEHIYQGGLLAGGKLYQETDKPLYLKRIFEINEKSKGRLLFGVVRDIEAKKVALPEDLQQKEKKLVKELALVKGKLNKEYAKEESKQDKAKIRLLEHQYFDNNLEYEKLNKWIEHNNRIYYKLKYNVSTVNIEQIQKTLEDEDILVEYFVTPKSLYIFYVSKYKYDVKIVKKTVNWCEKAMLLKQHINSLNFQFKEVAFELYQQLIQPIEHKIQPNSKLIIIPDKDLFNIPFDVLLTKQLGEQHNDYTKMPYLLNYCKSITYHYSATLWSNTPKYENTVPSSFVGFAPKYDNIKYKNLPYSERELETIARLLQKVIKDVPIFLNEEATVQQFIQTLEDGEYDIIHIAAHGFYNLLFPSQSGVVFSDEELTSAKKIKGSEDKDTSERSLENDTEEENKLYLDHTLALRLDTQLMVLNFCNSGLGKAIEGEGMIAMNRSFLYAGAKNIIYTLTKVNDQDAYELSCTLYKYILSGMSYTEALHRAKIDFAKVEGVTPKSWCSFMYLGR